MNSPHAPIDDEDLPPVEAHLLDEPPSMALASMVDELRARPVEAPAPADDFDAIFAKIEASPSNESPAIAEPKVLKFPWYRAAVALPFAAAAAYFLYAGTKAPERPTAVVAQPVFAGAGVVAPLGAKGLTISGVAATGGAELREGSTLVSTSRASFARPGKVRWLLEGETASAEGAAQVLEAREGLRVALQHGAIEADVTPVVNGEAFSVDIAGTRVAVHGTHLRVARVENTIVIDLSHGVIALGAPGKSRVVGEEIQAPAHIEFPVGHPEQKSVRSVDLREPELFDDAGNVITQAPVVTATALSGAEARKRLAEAVDVCSRRGRTAAGVQITVNSTGTVGGDHTIPHFSPPLRPDIQACVAARFAHVVVSGSAVSVPVQFTYR